MCRFSKDIYANTKKHLCGLQLAILHYIQHIVAGPMVWVSIPVVPWMPFLSLN